MPETTMMKQSEKVSVIIPLYNGAQYIEKTINSILRSDYENIEVLIIDDGSTDNGYTVCERLRQTDNRIIIYRQENGGVASARNCGVSMATGAYLCFCDQDDTVDRQCYAKQIERLENDQSDICMCSVGRSIDGKLSVFEQSDDACYEGEEILEQLLYPIVFNGFAPPFKIGNRSRYPHIWSCMFRMRFWRKYCFRFRAYVNFEDDLLVKIQALAKAERVSTIAHVGYYWCVNLHSETYNHRYIENIAERQRSCYDDMYQSIAGRIIDDAVLNSFEAVVYCRQYLEAVHNITVSDKNLSKKEIKAYYNENIYNRKFKECIVASKYVKKNRIKPGIVLWLLSKRQTWVSYHAEILLDKIMQVTLHSQILTKVERRLKGIK